MPDETGEENTLYELQEVLRIFVESDLRELSLDYQGIALRVSRDGSSPRVAPPPTRSGPVEVADAGGTTASAPPSPDSSSDPPASAAPAAPPAAPGPDGGQILITSPSAGYFHRRPAPAEPPYVEVGQCVDAGAAVCVIEVMKMFTEVTTAVAGVISEIPVGDGDLVYQDDVLMVLVPRSGPV